MSHTFWSALWNWSLARRPAHSWLCTLGSGGPCSRHTPRPQLHAVPASAPHSVCSPPSYPTWTDSASDWRIHIHCIASMYIQWWLMCVCVCVCVRVCVCVCVHILLLVCVHVNVYSQCMYLSFASSWLVFRLISALATSGSSGCLPEDRICSISCSNFTCSKVSL